MVVEREDSSVTPMGMTFSELLAMAAATQTPGIIGHARVVIPVLTLMLFSPSSRKGGIRR